MERRSAESVLLGESGERSRGRIGRNTENQIIIRVNVLLEADFVALRCDRQVRQVKVAPTGDRVGKQVATLEFQLAEHPILQASVEDLVGMSLNGQVRVLQKGEPRHLT